ncbi:MAG: PAS domain S-box protein [Candidatus Hodarchaeales archaeon]|jgi:PAS domain S-box-containing protein
MNNPIFNDEEKTITIAKEPLNILLVDDEQNFLEMSSIYLTELIPEFKIDFLSDPERVIDRLGEKKYAVIVSDYQMPGIDGLELLKTIRQCDHTIPFIIFTGRGREEVAIEALNLGAEYYIKKGGDPKSQYTELSHVIRKVVSHKLIEEELIKSESKYKTLFHETPVGILTSDNKGRIQSINKVGLQLLGSSSEEDTKKINLLTFPPLIKVGVSDNLTRCLEEGQSINSIIRYTSTWNKTGIYNYKIVPLMEDDKKVTGALFAYIDISEKIEIEKELKESEELFTQFMDHIPAATFIKDPEGRTLFANKYLKDVFGGDRWIGKTTIELFPEEVARKMMLDDEKALTEGLQVIIEELRDIDGVVNPYQTIKFPIKREDQPNLLGGISIDITERKETETKLIASEKKFRDIVELLPDMIYETNFDLDITYVNPIGYEKFGYSEDDVKKGINVSSLISHEHSERAYANIKAILHGEITQPSEYLVVKKGGSTFNALIHSRAIYKNGKIIGLRGTLKDITELKEAEMKLRISEEKYRMIFESIPDLFFLVASDSTILDYSGKEDDLYLPPEEFLGKRMAYILPEKTGKLIQDAIRRTIETRKSSNVEYSLPIREEDLYFEGRLFYYPENKVAIFIRNITELKKADEALRESEMKFHNFIKKSYDGIILTDEEGRIIEWNESQEQISGLKSEEMLGKQVWDSILEVTPVERRTPQFLERVKKMTEELLKTGEGTWIHQIREHDIFLSDGTNKTIETTSFPIETRKGYMIGSIVRDITEAKKAENDLRETTEQIQALVKSSPIAVISIDVDNNITMWNPAAEKMFGWCEKEVLGKFNPIVPEEGIIDFKTTTSKVIQGEVVTGKELKRLKKDGSLIDVSLTTAPLRDTNGKTIGVFGLFMDITDRLQLEKERKEQEQRRRTFIETVTHELKTPITGIKGFADILRDGELLPEERLTCLDNIEKYSSQLERLVNEIGELSKIDRGVFELDTQTVIICDFLEKEMRGYRTLYGESFEFSTCETCSVPVEVDKNRLRQVLDNLLNNAVKHSPADTREISLQVNLSTDAVRIGITDNGAGIEPKNLERIFEPFVSIKSKYSTQGTGIGLYLSRLIVEKHGGSLKAFSKGLDKGSTFIIELSILK